MPPPLIDLGPADQTLPAHSVASLPCVARGDPQPSITWFKDSNPLDISGRLTVTPGGTLKIDGQY